MMRSVVDNLVELLPPPPVPSVAFDLVADPEPEDPVGLALAVDELVTLPPAETPEVELADAVTTLPADCVTDDIV